MQSAPMNLEIINKFPESDYTIVDKSKWCLQNEHGNCEGEITFIIDGSKLTKICECQCHNNMYQLIRRMHTFNDF